MKERNAAKAKLLYDYLDSSKLFRNGVNKEDRSMMNVTFVTGNPDLDAKFVKEATAAGFVNLMSTSRVTAPWAACARPSTTPCPMKACRSWSNS